jgi:hypothetical protein
MYHRCTHNTPKPIGKIPLLHPQYRKINLESTIVVSAIPQNHPEMYHCDTHNTAKSAGKIPLAVLIKGARTAVDKKYRAIAERINALVVVEGQQTYENFVRTLNVIIAKYMAAIHTKHKKT